MDVILQNLDTGRLPEKFQSLNTHMFQGALSPIFLKILDPIIKLFNMPEDQILDPQNVTSIKLWTKGLITLDYSKFYTQVVATGIEPVNYIADPLSPSGPRIVFFDYIHTFLNLVFMILVQHSEPSFYLSYKIALKHSLLSVCNNQIE